VVLTGSAGKTFSGPQSGIIVWNDPQLTGPLTASIFPVLAATHQVNRVAALAVAAAEMIEYGNVYMAQIVKNSQALGKALDERGIPVIGAQRGYSRTHQVIANVRQFGGGLEVAHLLAGANIITNKNLVPGDRPEDWDRPSGLRIGTIEITRLGLRERIWLSSPDSSPAYWSRTRILQQLPGRRRLRLPLQTIYYNFDNGRPHWW
jgi:glycine hydroxymethyltransferase